MDFLTATCLVVSALAIISAGVVKAWDIFQEYKARILRTFI